MAERLSPPRRPAGFTLVEMMIATLIFSMVIAGFAAIYTTAFSQSGTVLRDARVKSTAMVSFKSFTQSMAAATRVTQPPINSSGGAVTGCANMAPDDIQHVAGAVSSFGYCVQPSPFGACEAWNNPDATRPGPCLFAYTWNVCPPPALSNGNCGGVVNGSAPDLLATRVLLPDTPRPSDDCAPSASNAFFTRGGNDVRIRVRLCHAKKGKVQVQWYDAGTVAHGQFDSRL